MKHRMSGSPAETTRRGENAILKAQVWELVAMGALLFAYEAGESFSSEFWIDSLNIVGPIGLAVILLLGAYRIAFKIPDGIWTALFWFRIATAVYFSVGSLVPIFGNDATETYLKSVSDFQPQQLYKLNIITAWSVFIILSVTYVLGSLPRLSSRPRTLVTLHRDRLQPSDILPIAAVLIAIGTFIKYFILLPNTLGWTNIIVPGVIQQLADVNLIGFYLLAIWSLLSSLKFFPLVVSLIVGEMLYGLLTFNKSIMLYALIVLSLGLLKARVTRFRMIAMAVTFTAFFTILQPLVAQARFIQGETYKSLVGGTLQERLEMLWSYFDPTAIRIDDGEVQSGLARLSYVNVATYVINQYDSGLPGDTLSDGWTMLIPRFLWPDKPIFAPGAELWFLINGTEGNSVSSGLFAEGYWNYGWAGLPLLLIPYAVSLFYLSVFALSVMERQAWIYMPVLFMALKIGVRVDGVFIIDVLGALAITLGLGICCHIFALHTEKQTQKMAQKRSGPRAFPASGDRLIYKRGGRP